MLAPEKSQRLAALLFVMALSLGLGFLALGVTRRDLAADVQVLVAARLSLPPGQVVLTQARVHPLGELRLQQVALAGQLHLRDAQVFFDVAQAARGRFVIRAALAQEGRLRWGALAATSGGLSLQRKDAGWRLTARGARVTTPALLWPVELEQVGVQLTGKHLRRAAASGVRWGPLGPLSILLGAGPGDDQFRFRGDLAGAQLRGVVTSDALEARLDLRRFDAAALHSAVLDLSRANISGGLHVLASRDPGPQGGLITLSGDGRIDASALTINHPAISAAPLSRLDLAVEGALMMAQVAQGAQVGLRLESSGVTLHLGDLTASLAGALVPLPEQGYKLDLEFTLRPMDCSALLRSLPRALLPKLDGLGVGGRIGGRAALHVDSRLLPALAVENDLALDCRVLRDPPLADVHDLLNPGLYIERPGPDGNLRRLPLGVSAPVAEDTPGFQSLGALPWPVVRAFLVAEDNLFFTHQGFDSSMIVRALGLDLQDQQAARGASTISQQVAKNIWLGPERSLERKLEELVLTWRLEQVVPKARVLETYLNLVELGSGIYGISMAAQHYFRMPADGLTPEQAAQLAALLPAPRRGMDAGWARRYRDLLQRMARVTIPRQN